MYSLECDELVSQVFGEAGKLILGIGSQKTTRVAVLWMREMCSLHCRLVDYALDLTGENNTSETVTCMATAERYLCHHCTSISRPPFDNLLLWAQIFSVSPSSFFCIFLSPL